MRISQVLRFWHRLEWCALHLAVLGAVASPSSAAGAPPTAGGVAVVHEDFESPLAGNWAERAFPRIKRWNTFRVARAVDGNRFLQVESDRSSSGMGVRLHIDSQRCPDARWRWTVSATLPMADLTRKDGDDAAAKLCVVFDGPSRWNPVDKRILVYVWDDALPEGSLLPNAWLPDNARMLVVESGRDRVGQWTGEHVDLAADFARAFPGETPGTIEAVVFLADTDDTNARVTAGLDDLTIRCTSTAPRSAAMDDRRDAHTPAPALPDAFHPPPRP